MEKTQRVLAQTAKVNRYHWSAGVSTIRLEYPTPKRETIGESEIECLSNWRYVSGSLLKPIPVCCGALIYR